MERPKKDNRINNNNRINNKKAGIKSEVYPFKVEEIKRMIDYFIDKEMWIYYLAFVISCNIGRRVSDTLSLTWNKFFNPSTGKFRSDIEILEKKTGDLVSLHINNACKDAINLYIEKTGCNVSAENYSLPVFVQLSGNFKGTVLSDSAFLKVLKKTAEAIGVERNIGTHSLRKTFGMLTIMLHPADGFALPTLQYMFHHADQDDTLHYIGITKERIDGYLNDIGNFFSDYIIGEKEYKEESGTPLISLDINDLTDVIKSAYQLGKVNASETDAMVHVNAITSIMKKIGSLQK